MNEVVSITILLFEVLMVLQCLQIAFKQEIKIDKYTVAIILIDLGVYYLINLKIIGSLYSVVVYVLFWVYCYVEFKQTVLKTFVGFIFGFVFAGCTESVIAFVLSSYQEDNNLKKVLFFSSATAFFLIYCGRKGIKLLKSIILSRTDICIYGITILLGFSMVVMLIDYYWNQEGLNIYIVYVIILLLIALFYLYRVKVMRNEIEKRNYELELHSIYGGAYDDLIYDVRRRQHDFKNQLSVIYSMHLVASSMDELIHMQKEYGDTIQHEGKYDAILTNCNNSILAGYLYHRCLLCENDKILVDYNIHIDQAKCCFQLCEVIEVFGILFDNAYESVMLSCEASPLISVDFIENEYSLVIGVSNPSNYISYSEIAKMFVKGYSTKGVNRGFGLTRVIELTKKHKAELRVSNFEREKKNWINFTITISK